MESWKDWATSINIIVSIIIQGITIGMVRQQLRANIISTSRQRWIDAFTSDVSGLISSYFARRSLGGYPGGQESINQLWQHKCIDLKAALDSVAYRVILRLRSKNCLHKKLEDKVNELIRDNKDETVPQILRLTREIIEHEQKLISQYK